MKVTQVWSEYDRIFFVCLLEMNDMLKKRSQWVPGSQR